MNRRLFAERVTHFVTEKGLSEYEISRSIDFSETYINKLTSGKIWPSMSSFFILCDYFEISPEEFFDEKLNDRTRNLIETFSELSDSDKIKVEEIAEALLYKKKHLNSEELKSEDDSDL